MSDLLSLIDELIQLVSELVSQKSPIARNGEEAGRLKRLDAEIYGLSQREGVSIPTPTSASYPDTPLMGFCRIPFVEHAGGYTVVRDVAWEQAMRGLRRVVELKAQPGDSTAQDGEGEQITPTD